MISAVGILLIWSVYLPEFNQEKESHSKYINIENLFNKYHGTAEKSYERLTGK